MVGSSLESNQKAIVQQIIDATFDEVNSIYNKWNPNSELSKLNLAKAHTQVKLSKELENLLTLTSEMVTLSNGKFDPTIEPLQKLWKKALSKGTIPSDAAIEKKLTLVGFDNIHIKNGFFSKDHESLSLDLGGIAKGFAVDLLVTRLNAAGYLNVFVEWGGEIKATGIHPEFRPWHIFIARLHDKNPDNAIATLDLHSQAIATSGDYLQNWTIKKDNKLKTYFHVFDKNSGKPRKIKHSSIGSASVIANSCMVADAIATALMLFDNKEEALKWVEEVKMIYPEIVVYLFTRADR